MREGEERDQREGWSMERCVLQSNESVLMKLVKLGMNCSALLSCDIMYQSHSQTGRPGNETDETVVPMKAIFSLSMSFTSSSRSNIISSMN